MHWSFAHLQEDLSWNMSSNKLLQTTLNLPKVSKRSCKTISRHLEKKIGFSSLFLFWILERHWQKNWAVTFTAEETSLHQRKSWPCTTAGSRGKNESWYAQIHLVPGMTTPTFLLSSMLALLGI